MVTDISKARVALPDEDEATGEIKEFYQEVLEYTDGRVSSSSRIHAADEDLRQAFLGFLKRDLGDSTVPHELSERIALVVSDINSSKSCMSTHSEKLEEMGVPEDEIRSLVADHHSPDTDEKQKAALDYATQIVEEAKSVTDVDVETLQELGYTDNQIREIAVLACYHDYISKLNFAIYDRE